MTLWIALWYVASSPDMSSERRTVRLAVLGRWEINTKLLSEIPKRTNSCEDMAVGDKYKAFLSSYLWRQEIYQIGSVLSPGISGSYRLLSYRIWCHVCCDLCVQTVLPKVADYWQPSCVRAVNRQAFRINTFTAIVVLSRFNNSCLKSPASTLVDLTFQSRALSSFSLNQLRNLSL